MKPALVLILAACSAAGANVSVTRQGDVAHVAIDGSPFTDFFFGPDTPKPYLHPLRSASGKVVTRSFPMAKVEGETTTDQHHRGVWLGERFRFPAE
jgi:hypothetical protein